MAKTKLGTAFHHKEQRYGQGLEDTPFAVNYHPPKYLSVSTNFSHSSYTSNLLDFFSKAVAIEIWPLKDWFWSNTLYAQEVYKSQRKTNHGRESLPSSVAPDGTDKGMLCTPTQQRGSFITVIFTCPKGAQSKLMWRFFNDSWDWSIPSVFNTEIASFILRWEPFRISLCNFLSSERQTAFPLFFPLHLSARLLLGEWHKFKKESLRTLPPYF